MCEYKDGEWINKNEFSIGEEVYICFSISSNEEEDTYPITYRVYKQDIPGSPQEYFVYSARYSIEEGRIHIPFDFEKGKYLVEVICDRTNLFTLPFTVVSFTSTPTIIETASQSKEIINNISNK
jgi:hypothetical protein